jgi:hypothetical protein
MKTIASDRPNIIQGNRINLSSTSWVKVTVTMSWHSHLLLLPICFNARRERVFDVR